MRTLDEFELVAFKIAAGVPVEEYSLKLIARDGLVYWFLYQSEQLIYVSSIANSKWVVGIGKAFNDARS